MKHQLSDAEWDDLIELIAASPAERIDQALKRVVLRPRTGRPPKRRLIPTSQPVTLEGRLIHLAVISPGAQFDRALLTELRRLSVH
jgi:hypothetical protein